MALNLFSEIDITPTGDDFYEAVEKCKTNWATLDAHLETTVYPEDYGTVDGTADEVQINLAIADCAGSRCAVELTAQEYVIAASIVMDQDNVTLRSFNKSVIKIADSTDIDRIIYLSGNNCLVEGIKFDGNLTGGADGSGIESTGNAVTVATFEARYNEFVDIGEYGLQLYGIMTDFSIHHNRFVGSSKTMISFQLGTTGSVTRADVSHNYLNNSEGHGIQFYGDNEQTVDYITIIGNTVTDIDDTGINGIGIEINLVNNAEYTVVSNNIVHDCRMGLSITSTHSVISGNVISGATSYGMELGRGDDITVTGNEIFNCERGMEWASGCDGFVISGNHFGRTTGVGANSNSLRMDSSLGGYQNGVISNNAFIDPHGNAIVLTPHVDNKKITISNNIGTYTTARTVSIVWFIGGASDLTLSENSIFLEVDYPAVNYNGVFYIYTAGSIEFSNIYMLNNTISGTVSGGVDSLAVRIGAAATDVIKHVYIKGNVFKGFKRTNYLVRSYTGNPYLLFRDNEFENRTDQYTVLNTNAPVTKDRASVVPTGGGLWRFGDVVWHTVPVTGTGPGWICVDFRETTTSGAEASGQSVISVTSATGMTAGDNFSIELDDGDWHHTTIVSIATDDVTITDVLPSDAASGNEVITSLFKEMADLQ